MPRRSILVILLILQAGLIVTFTNPWHPVRPVLALMLPAFGLSLVTLALLRRAELASEPNRRALRRGLIGGCLLLQLAAIVGTPVSSDDDYRYAWDAKVQLHGIDPYRYAPADFALIKLRDSFTFPDRHPCTRPVAPNCTVINRAGAHTIYPPVAEAAFTAIRIASFGGRGGHRPMQVAGLLGALATTLLLLRSATDRDTALWPIAAWAWNPIVALEATSNAHIEWLAVLTAVAGLIVLRRGQPIRAGLALGAAIATKLYPAVLLVAAGRRRRPGWLTIATAIALVVAVYLPHVAVVGPKVIGYLPGYLREESYSSGTRYLFLSWLPSDAAGVLAPAILLGVLGWLWWHADAAGSEGTGPEQTALYAVAALLLITTPGYSWYGLLLMAMIALTGRWEFSLLAAAPMLAYMGHDIGLVPPSGVWIGYGAGAGLLVVVSVGRRLATRRAPDAMAGAVGPPDRPSRRTD